MPLHPCTQPSSPPKGCLTPQIVLGDKYKFLNFHHNFEVLDDGKDISELELEDN